MRMRRSYHLIGNGIGHAKMHQSHHSQDQQYIAAQESSCLSPEEEPFDQPYIINIEDRHEAERDNDAPHIVFHRVDS